MSAALEEVRARLGSEVLGLIGGGEVRTNRTIVSVDPANPASVVAVSACCGPTEGDRAVELAASAFGDWSRTGAADRAGVLFRAADWLRLHRLEVAALEVFEAGKCWDDADGDVAEAIDYLEYYGRQGLRLSFVGEVQSPPGEINRLTYHGRGVAAVISPWNFPLAIRLGW
jgi:acyl-CoA reductase-like NAD-dependent aldehyde dehydrogenase